MTSLSARSIYAFLGSVLLLVLALMVPAQQSKAKKAPAPEGQQAYLNRCAPCHGDKGQGAAAYPRTLTGNLSVTELARFIKKSMPPGPVKCPAPDADKIAAFIHDAFYSPIAQDRNRPARIELARLTVRQFRNAVSDLVGGSRPVIPSDPARGLHGEYFKGRDMDASQRVIDRTDPEVQFDFGTDGPEPGKFDPHTFSATWQGSVLAPDTGEYEFIIRSDQSVRLYFNGWDKPLIDAWVKSGSDTEFRGSVFLLEGRAYPLLLQFSKASQGVDDSDKKKGKPAPKASVEFLWKPPKSAPQLIPTRYLFPQPVGPTFVVTTTFPPDDRSIGYERGTTVSKEWDDATTEAALETADYMAAHLRDITGVPDDAGDRKERLMAYCRQFVARAFRRPLAKDVEQTYVIKQFEVAPNLETAVKRVVILTLKSPRFLYREIVPAKRDGYWAASQLSFGLWDTIPDPQLESVAPNGLTTQEAVTAQAQRLAQDPRAWNKLREFLLRWLKVDEVPDIVKNPKRYPDFDASAVADLRTSLEIFLEDTIWNPDSDYRELLLSKKQYLNGRLGKLYGANLPEDAPFQPVELDPGQRAGVLTQPYLLSRFAYLDGSSPIHRGVLIARNMLGRTLRPPPAAFAPLAASLHPDLTTRQRVALQTKPEMCNSCHGMINPLGFTLERFDAIGRLRAQDNGKPVDATGSYRTRTGEVVKFTGALDLAHYLADSDEAHDAFVEKLFQHMVKQPMLAYGGKMLPDLENSFAKNRYSVRSLMVQIMVATTLAEKAMADKTGPIKAAKGATK